MRATRYGTLTIYYDTPAEYSPSFPSLGGVAGPKGLTGWSVTFPHTPRKPPRRYAPPLLRRGMDHRKSPPWEGWSAIFLHTPRLD